MKSALKAVLNFLALSATIPFALTSGFGRIESIYSLWAQSFALFPGLPGDYLRIAYYYWTLQQCSLDSRIQFGSFFSHPQASVGRHVYIGSYCVLGRTTIGDRTHLASSVQILSGARQHGRDAQGQLQGSELANFQTIPIGADCWIGAAAIIMAEVGGNSTVGAGSVVTRPIPSGVVAVGSPAKPIPASS